MRLLQLQRGSERRVALVREPEICFLDERIGSVYALVQMALTGGARMVELINAACRETAEYDPIWAGESEWKLMVPLDHPGEPARVCVAGTGLTHLGSAKSRNAMHGEGKDERQKTKDESPETDSMKMFRWGIEGGKPGAGAVGIAPEWFYKGTGTILRAHNEALEVPAFGEDGGEECEIVGLYVIAADGTPVRVGMAQGNEFSDHVFEKKNYLNLAGSKLRTCSIGPEIAIGADFSQVPGHGRVMRMNAGGQEEILWSKPLASGEEEMSHSLANLEHHHFKFPAHRRPGDVHVHFFGTCALSYADGVRLKDGDIMQVHYKGFGRPLRNPLKVVQASSELVKVRALD